MTASTPQHHSSFGPSGSTFSASAPPGQERAPAPRDRARSELRFWAYLTVAALSAILLLLVAVVAVQLTNEGGLARILTALLIATLGALAVYASAAATQAA